MKRNFYTMTQADDTLEISMRGDIVAKRPCDYKTGLAEAGDYIVKDEFIADLDSFSNYKKLVLRMDSCGGDAGVAIYVNHKLKELSSAGVQLTCIVDGVAMSGGSLIMCACDTVKVHSSSIIMIHKSWSTVMGSFNADDLRKLAMGNDAYDKSQMEIYRAKTGLSEEELLEMMANETYMTGEEAVEKGFADELLEGGYAIAASADRRSLYVKGRRVQLPLGLKAPEDLETIEEMEDFEEPLKDGEGGNMTKEEFKEKYPELYAEIEAEIKKELEEKIREDIEERVREEAIIAERERIRDIDAISSRLDPSLVREAKYDKVCDAKELTYKAALRAVEQGQNYMSAVMTDSKASGVGSVEAAGVNVLGEYKDLTDIRANTPELTRAQEMQRAAEKYARIKNGGTL